MIDDDPSYQQKHFQFQPLLKTLERFILNLKRNGNPSSFIWRPDIYHNHSTLRNLLAIISLPSSIYVFKNLIKSFFYSFHERVIGSIWKGKRKNPEFFWSHWKSEFVSKSNREQFIECGWKSEDSWRMQCGDRSNPTAFDLDWSQNNSWVNYH